MRSPIFQPGMWARSADDTSRPMLGRVREVHSDGSIDVVIFAADGERLGRVSPAMGGPSSFEPCCGAENWIPIERPNFDLLATKRYEYSDCLKPITLQAPK